MVNIKKYLLPVVLMVVLFAAPLAACTPDAPSSEILPTAAEVQQNETAPTEAPPAPSQSPATGFINGLVYGSQGPPNPPMVIYAVNTNSNSYISMETPQTQGEAPYSLELPPGTYLLYAFANEGHSGYAGYTEDGWTLAPLTITAGQTLSDITIRPPSQSQCGAMLRLPASPDGRFAEIPGPTDECMAAAIAQMTAEASAAAEPDQLESELMRVEFPPGGTVAQLHGSLLAGGADHYVLKASAKQKMIVDLQSAGNAIIIIFGADGVVLTSEQEAASNWMGDLTLTQDYFIDVRSTAGETTTYAMDVIIPPLDSEDAPSSSTTPGANVDKTPGAISGGIVYPASSVPAFHVVAFNTENSFWYWVGFTPNTWAYSLTDLPPGTYNIVAYPDGAGLEGGYASAGGALLPVKVEPGKTTPGIDINIWLDPAASPYPNDPL
jgi:hypothetical protein